MTSDEMRSLRDLKGTLGWHPGAGIKLGLVVLGCTAIIPFQSFILRFALRFWAIIPGWWSRQVARIVGARVTVHGAPAKGPVLFVSNHISWLDIPILGGRLPGSFIAKSEVDGWSGIGAMARLYRCVFVNRSRRRDSASQRDEIKDRLAAGDGLILFAEGTSTDGTLVKPFKTALFAVAQAVPDLKIQPVTIAYTHLNGIPISRSQRPLIGWYGDMELTGHVWRLLKLGHIRAEVRFHAPISWSEAGDRKSLAIMAHDAVSSGLIRAHAGLPHEIQARDAVGRDR